MVSARWHLRSNAGVRSQLHRRRVTRWIDKPIDGWLVQLPERKRHHSHATYTGSAELQFGLGAIALINRQGPLQSTDVQSALGQQAHQPQRLLHLLKASTRGTSLRIAGSSMSI